MVGSAKAHIAFHLATGGSGTIVVRFGSEEREGTVPRNARLIMAGAAEGWGSLKCQQLLERALGDVLLSDKSVASIRERQAMLQPAQDLLVHLVIPEGDPAAEIPWEIARHEGLENEPLLVARGIQVVRSPDATLAEVRPLSGLRVLVAAAERPHGQQTLDASSEVEAICKVANESPHSELVVDEPLRDVTADALETAVKLWRPDVVHLICHGHDQSAPTGSGVSLTEGFLPSRELARIVRTADTRAVVLACCNGSSAPRGARSIANVLLHHGVLAAVGMQYPSVSTSGEADRAADSLT